MVFKRKLKVQIFFQRVRIFIQIIDNEWTQHILTIIVVLPKFGVGNYKNYIKIFLFGQNKSNGTFLDKYNQQANKHTGTILSQKVQGNQSWVNFFNFLFL